MLKAVESDKFTCDPSFYKHMMIVLHKEDANSRLHINASDIDELIQLLTKAKQKFR
ncbi:hypothetical protein [Brevibacillus sp. NRS-1366]|uniref:hypothetical protein n=1 Tax=Brevibacillus sp. NRS-1366 TaxID=3233899 RepID=UPI003D21B954